MLEVLEKERKQIIQGPGDEICLGSNLNATLALLPYLDLVWVKRLLSICEFKEPDVFIEGTYLYAGLFLSCGTMYAGELGGRVLR